MKRPKKIPASVKNRFLIRVPLEVDTSDAEACWNWTGAVRSRGYGIIVHSYSATKRKGFYTHRIAYEIWVGPTKDLCVLHKCDNERCINPKHLFLGTNADNLKDSIAKGRLLIGGEEHSQAKLTHDEVDEIRSLWKTGAWYQYEIAEMFEMSRSQIHNIVHQLNWTKPPRKIVKNKESEK